MSLTGKKGAGIPLILLHDSEGSIVTIEMKNGYTLRGLLDDTQDTMNCTLKARFCTNMVIVTSPDLMTYITFHFILFVLVESDKDRPRGSRVVCRINVCTWLADAVHCATGHVEKGAFLQSH